MSRKRVDVERGWMKVLLLMAFSIFVRLCDSPHARCVLATAESSCGASDNEPLPALSSDVHPDPFSIELLHTQASALTPEFSSARSETIAEQACFLPISDRGRPMLGPVKGLEGVYVASGHSCWGITQGPGTGLVMSEIVLEGKAKSADVSRLLP